MGKTTLAEKIADLTKDASVSESPAEGKPLRADARRNRERVIAVARATFSDEGADVQMEEIAKRAGVGIGTLYRNFPTKDALFGEVIRVHMARVVDAFVEALKEPDIHRAFRGLVLTGAEEGAKHIGLRELVAQFPDAARCGGANERYDALLTEFLGRAHRECSIRADVTVADLRALICGLSSSIAAGGDWRRCAEVLLAGPKPPG